MRNLILEVPRNFRQADRYGPQTRVAKTCNGRCWGTFPGGIISSRSHPGIATETGDRSWPRASRPARTVPHPQRRDCSTVTSTVPEAARTMRGEGGWVPWSTHPLILWVAVEPNGAVVLKVSGELDAVTAPQLSAELAARNSSHGLVIDLSELTFVDSSGVHVLAHTCAEQGTRVVCRTASSAASWTSCHSARSVPFMPTSKKRSLPNGCRRLCLSVPPSCTLGST